MQYQLSRRRQINRKGQPATLQRPNSDLVTFNSVALKVFKVPYSRRPGHEDEGDPSDGQAEITNDEISAAGWPGPPQTGDTLILNNHHWFVVRSDAVFDGATLIGYSMWIRGGV